MPKNDSKNDSKKILLSFDTEEFDVPREGGVDFPLEEAMKVSREGTTAILDILERQGVRATFFCTTNFAENAPDIMERILAGGHEVAAHGCDHWRPVPADVFDSRDRLQELTGRRVNGYRQPRMFAVSDADIREAGYIYNSSLNPCFLPGHYNHLDKPRRAFLHDGVLQIPASVTPGVRFPMFWLSLHHLPLKLYKSFADKVLRSVGYFVTYFHPWEFYPLGEHPEWKIKWVTRRNAGVPMRQRLESLIDHLKERGEFVTYTEFTLDYLNVEHERNDN